MWQKLLPGDVTQMQLFNFSIVLNVYFFHKRSNPFARFILEAYYQDG